MKYYLVLLFVAVGCNRQSNFAPVKLYNIDSMNIQIAGRNILNDLHRQKDSIWNVLLADEQEHRLNNELAQTCINTAWHLIPYGKADDWIEKAEFYNKKMNKAAADYRFHAAMFASYVHAIDRIDSTLHKI